MGQTERHRSLEHVSDLDASTERTCVTVPIDITDPRIVKAYAHPLRVHILGLLDNRIASPSEIANELGAPLGNTSYHVRQLVALGLVELVRRRQRRGAIEHYYTARVRPTTTDDGWAKLPEIVRRTYIGGTLQQAVRHMVASTEQGGFSRDDIHYSRTAGPLDAKGWRDASRELAATLKRIERIFDESKKRLDGQPHVAGDHSTVLLMHFAGPEPGSLSEHDADATAGLSAMASKAAKGSDR